MVKLLKLTWEDFDKVIEESRLQSDLEGLYGIPRGGLTLAVALSHFHKIPLVNLSEMKGHKILFVDDIADQGTTMKQVLGLHENYRGWVWIKRLTCPLNIEFATSLNNEDWVIFPWEREEHAIAEYNDYVSR